MRIHYKKFAMVIAIFSMLYFLIVAYKTNVYYYDTVRIVKQMTPNGMKNVEVGKGFFECLVEVLPTTIEYFEIPKGFSGKIFFPTIFFGVIVSIIIYSLTYFRYKERFENREGHEHGGAHLLTDEELAIYQKTHMSM